MIRERDIVLADEKRLRILKDASGKPKTGFVWTFGAADASGGFDVAYHFTDSRSGSTPKAVLKGTKGVLLVDGYSGYNDIEKVSSRPRSDPRPLRRRARREGAAPFRNRQVGVSEGPGGTDPGAAQGLARRAALQAPAEEPARGGDPIHARPVERACESRGINPFDYLAGVLARVQDHPAKAIDELLPAAWAAER